MIGCSCTRTLGLEAIWFFEREQNRTRTKIEIKLKIKSWMKIFWKRRNVSNLSKCTRNILDCDQSNYSSRIIFSCIPPKLFYNSWKSSDNSFQRYGHFKFSKMAASCHLGFSETGNSAIRSAAPENPTLEPNMKWIGWPVAEIWPFEVFQNERSVGRSSVLNNNITLFSCTPLRYVRNVAREE